LNPHDNHYFQVHLQEMMFVLNEGVGSGS